MAFKIPPSGQGNAQKQEPDLDQIIFPPWTRRDVSDMLYIKDKLDWLLSEIKSGFSITEELHGWTIRTLFALGRELDRKEREFLAKAGYNPSQPRVSRGNPEGGQWTDTDGGRSDGNGSGGSMPQKPTGQTKPKIVLPTRKPHIPGQPRRLRTYPRNDNVSAVRKVEVDKDRNVTLHHEDGSTEKRTGGSPAWRNNNPGNLRPSDFSDRHGAVGSNNGMAVFPDAATGHEAASALLKGPTYSSLTIDEAVTRRSPSTENDTEKLKRDISERSGLSGKRKISDLKPEEFDRLLEAIYQFEGWSEGSVTKTPPHRAKSGLFF